MRDEDLPVKAIIAMMSLSNAYEAVRFFSLALEPKTDDPQVEALERRLQRAFEASRRAFTALAARPLPFDLSGTPFEREYRAI